MLPHLIEVIPLHILPFIDPEDAHSLSYVSKDLRKSVLRYYKTFGNQLIQVSGDWHGRLSKRARESLCTVARISWAPLGVASLVWQRCGVCRRRFRGACHPAFGILAHPECLLPSLISMDYVRHLKGEPFDIPVHTLRGASVVLKSNHIGLFPYHWTSRSLGEAPVKPAALPQEVDKRLMAQRKRIKRLTEHIDPVRVQRVVDSGLGSLLCGRYFDVGDLRCHMDASEVADLVRILSELLENECPVNVIKDKVGGPISVLSQCRNAQALLQRVKLKSDASIIG